MATLYGHGKGKAGSHPPKKEKPYWVKLNSEEIEAIIVKLAKEGKDSAKIGLILRDTYGIPSSKRVIGKKIQEVLKQHNISFNDPDLVNLEKKAKKLEKHFNKNKMDMVAKRGLQLTEAKIRRRKKYLESQGKI